MLNDSNSPLTALQSLLQWQDLPETKEVLQFLKDKADLAETWGKASPAKFIQNFTGIDGETIVQLRDHFIGEEKGLRHLSKLLAQRELELRETIKKQDETKT